MGQHAVDGGCLEEPGVVFHGEFQSLGTSQAKRVRSNLAVWFPERPEDEGRRCKGGRGAFWRANMTWKRGVRLYWRWGCGSSTSFSKGRSWWL